jgi:hypothetical protein
MATFQLEASNAFTNEPTHKKIQHKELVDGNNDEISKKNFGSPDLGRQRTRSIGWTVAEAAAVVANWKISRPENQEAKSAGNASKH